MEINPGQKSMVQCPSNPTSSLPGAGPIMLAAAAPQVAIQDGVTVVSLVGAEYENLDERLLDGIRTALLDIAQTTNPPLMVLDLSHTKFFGSAFIEILFRVANRMKTRGGKFALSGLTEYCAEVIHITHLDSLWPVLPETAAAVARLKA
jgi:anti-sigma B factor antagonist